MATVEAIATAFLKHYYTCYDTDRAQLASLYVWTTTQPASTAQHSGSAHHSRRLLWCCCLLLLPAAQKEHSLLSAERETVQGSKILDKLKALPRMVHNVSSMQAQPTASNTILILVNGDIKIEGQDNILKFSQTFQLAQDAASSSFYIQNDIFSLNIS
jgi:hypothetical protein